MKCEHVVDVAIEGRACLGAIEAVVACWPGRINDGARGAAGGGGGAIAALT